MGLVPNALAFVSRGKPVLIVFLQLRDWAMEQL